MRAPSERNLRLNASPIAFDLIEVQRIWEPVRSRYRRMRRIQVCGGFALLEAVMAWVFLGTGSPQAGVYYLAVGTIVLVGLGWLQYSRSIQPLPSRITLAADGITLSYHGKEESQFKWPSGSASWRVYEVELASGKDWSGPFMISLPFTYGAPCVNVGGTNWFPLTPEAARALLQTALALGCNLLPGSTPAWPALRLTFLRGPGFN